MQRPPSIVAFERCYLAAWAVGLANTLLAWRDVQGNPDVVNATAQLGTWFLPTITALYFAVPIAFWFFIARRGSVVAKWALTLCTVLWAVWTGLSLTITADPTTLAAIASLALGIVAVVFLFRKDTRAWFGEDLVEPA